MEQVTVGGRDSQAPRNHNGTTNLLNALNLPAPTRSTMVKVAGNVVPWAVGQGCCALLAGREVPRVNRARKIRQGFGSGSQRKLDGSRCLSTVAGCFEHLIDSLWSSLLQL